MKFSPPPWLGERIIGRSTSDAKLTVNFADVTPSEAFPKSPYKVVASSSVFKKEDIGRSIRLGFLPLPWKPKTLYEEGSYISMFGKVYQSVKRGVSGSEWLENKRDTFIADGGIQWKVVYSSQTLGSGSVEDKGSSGVVPHYYLWGDITAFYNDREVDIVFSVPFTCTNDQDTYKWNLSVWDPTIGGYPSHVTFYQNILVFSGTQGDASSFYLSEFENFNSFSPDGGYGGSDYLKALSSEITDDTVREIRWITPMGSGLLIGCDSSLWFFCIEIEKGVNLFMRKLSGSGVYSCSPLAVGNSILFVCGSGRCIKAVMGSFEQGFKFTDLTQFVDHLFTYRIKQLVYQGEPYSLVWVSNHSDTISSDKASLFGCRFSIEEENDFAWHVHNFGMAGIIAMTTFPSVDRGQTDLWFLVFKMGENNSSQVILERLERFHSVHNYHEDGDVGVRKAS